jgi:SAM-dependent methyltransferase
VLSRWDRYLAGYHDERPGITERLLAPAVARDDGHGPYAWLVEPLPASGPILDLACGSAPTRPLLPGRRWLGLDASAGELAAAAAAGRRPLVRALAEQLPIADATIGAVSAAMCLQVVTPIDDVLVELRRVLRPGGVLVAMVPSSRVGSSLAGRLGWWRVLRALKIGSLSWPNPHATDGLAKLLRVGGFTVDSDDGRVFWREVASPADAALVIDGLYLPDADPGQVASARQALASWARPGRRLPIPLRRVVAHLETRLSEGGRP